MKNVIFRRRFLLLFILGLNLFYLSTGYLRAGYSAGAAKIEYPVTLRKINIPGTSRQIFELHAFFPFAKQQVWAVLLDFPKYKRILKEVKDVQVLDKNDHQSTVKAIIDLPAMLPTIEHTLQVDFDETKGTVNWKMVDGKHIKTNEGSAVISGDPLGASIKATFDLRAGAWAPQFLIDREIKKMLPKIVQKLGRRMRFAPKGSAIQVNSAGPEGSSQDLGPKIELKKGANAPSLLR